MPVQITVQPLEPLSGADYAAWWTSAPDTADGTTILDACVKVSQGGSGGSGVMIGRGKGATVAVASAAHVFSALGPARVRLRDGSSYPAYVHDLDRRTDVALLSADIPEDKAAVFAGLAPEPPAVGTVAIKIGYPAYAGGKADVRRGPVLPTRGGFLFNAQLYVRPGDSGGGVFTESGALISIVSGYTSGDVLWGTGTQTLHAMVTKHGWGGCILPKLRDRLRPGKPPGGGPGKPMPPPLPPPVLPPVIPEPVKPPTDDTTKRLLDELALLRKEVAALQLKAGPPGKDGLDGLPGVPGKAGVDGLPGKDVDPKRLAELEAELAKLRGRPFVAELLDERGAVKQRVTFGPEQPLRLKLIPVK